ncbi:MAG: hypothetical protein NTX26_02910 [Candidatus Parcubacteria bacterium]|nr:hypothetical protein [Candidatus Parcubacteria bacterium]
MQKYSSKLFLISALLVGITLCFSVVFAKNENAQGINGEQHKSNIANIVQTLIKVSDKEPGEVGEQVREMAREQNEAKERVGDSIDEIQNRSGLKTFFIGTDYKNVGQVRSEIVQTRNQIKKVEKLIDRTTNPTAKTTLQAQLTALETEQQKIETFLKINESKFSLFGWFLRLFSRPIPTTTTTTSTVSTATTMPTTTASTTTTVTSTTTTVPPTTTSTTL